MHILCIVPELAPFSSVGELGQFCADLPRQLRAGGAEITVVTPFHRVVAPERFGIARRIRKLQVTIGDAVEEMGLYDGTFVDCDVPVFFIDHPASFDRAGLYGDESGPYPDNHRRYFTLSRAALALAADLELAPDVIQVVDWQTSFVPLLLQREVEPTLIGCPAVLALRDTAQLGLFPEHGLDELGLGRELFTPDELEFHGQVSALKAGLLHADSMIATSPSRVEELCSEQGGHGLHGLYAARRSRLHGVVTGVDPLHWSPEDNHRLPASFDSDDLAPKRECRRALQRELDLSPQDDVPLVVMIEPEEPRHGLELACEAVSRLEHSPLQLAVFGRVSAPQRLAALREQLPGRVAHDERPVEPDHLQRVLAGADALLLPLSEDHGTTLQHKAMRFGAAVVAHRIGALRDTVVEFDRPSRTGTGFGFEHLSAEGLSAALHRLTLTFADPPAWQALARTATRQHEGFSMAATAARYMQVYAELTA